MKASSIMQGFIGPVIVSMGGFALLLCTFFIVWGGIAYITSSGNAIKLAHAKRILGRSLFGLVIVLAASVLSLILTHAFGAVGSSSNLHFPKLSAIQPGPNLGGLVGILLKAISGLFLTIIDSAAKPFISALSYFTTSTPLLTHNGSVFHLWLISTSIADSLLVLVIALIGFHIMAAEQLGLRDISLRTILPQMIAIFILINTSIYALDGLIELSNVMIVALRDGVGGISPWQGLIGIIANASKYSLPALIIFVIFVIFSVILIIYYIGRIVTLYLGAVLAPIILLLWLIPSFRDFAENAFKTYFATVFVLFIHVIILSLAGSLFVGVATTSNGSPDPVMSLLLGLATLIALIKTQGVLMQLNFASIGPRAARNLGGSFINGVSYLAVSARHSQNGLASSSLPTASDSNNQIPSRQYQPIGSSTNKASVSKHQL